MVGLVENLLEFETTVLPYSYIFLRDACIFTYFAAEVANSHQITAYVKLQLFKQSKLDAVINQAHLSSFDNNRSFGRFPFFEIEILISNESQIDEFLLISRHLSCSLLALLDPEIILRDVDQTRQMSLQITQSFACVEVDLFIFELSVFRMVEFDQTSISLIFELHRPLGYYLLALLLHIQHDIIEKSQIDQLLTSVTLQFQLIDRVAA